MWTLFDHVKCPILLAGYCTHEHIFIINIVHHHRHVVIISIIVTVFIYISIYFITSHVKRVGVLLCGQWVQSSVQFSQAVLGPTAHTSPTHTTHSKFKHTDTLLLV